MMKRKFDLSEKDIKEAIAWCLSAKHSAEVPEKDIHITASEKRDYTDRILLGYDISAVATCGEGK